MFNSKKKQSAISKGDFDRNQKITVIARPMQDYDKPEVQKAIFDKVRAICRNEGLSHAAIIEEMSFIFSMPNLTVYVPVEGQDGTYKKHISRTVTLYRRLLSYQLQVNMAGYPRHVPRQLSNVMDLDIYLKVRRKILNP